MSRLMLTPEQLVLATSETPPRAPGDEQLADGRGGGGPTRATPARALVLGHSDDGTSPSDAAIAGAGEGPGETVVADPMVPATPARPAACGPEPGATPVSNGARLLRVGSGQAFAILEGGAMIGRDRDCDLVVSGPAVSRRHSIVRRSMRGYVLTDVSRNGTYVNGRRVRGTRLLRTGDVLRVGDDEFRFEMSRATAYAGVSVPELLMRGLAQLRSTVPPAEITRRLVTTARLRAEPLRLRLSSASRRAWIRLRRTSWLIWARCSFACRAQARRLGIGVR